MWKFAILAMVGLSGCMSSAPQPRATLDMSTYASDHGTGYESYESYEVARIARARARGYGDATAPQPERVISSEELAAAGLPVAGGGLPAAEPVRSAPLDAMAPAGAPPDASRTRSGISDEQNFDAVSARETIESDARRLARQARSYQIIPPAPVPIRTGQGGPNIVAYALSTSNAVGEQTYRRGGIGLAGRSQRACARYVSADRAQEAFLARGGPETDRLGLDPDGDGFACAWDPAPFRAARG